MSLAWASEDKLPAVFSTAADPPATSMEMPQASFDMPGETLAHLGPNVKHEQDPTSSEFTSHS